MTASKLRALAVLKRVRLGMGAGYRGRVAPVSRFARVLRLERCDGIEQAPGISPCFSLRAAMHFPDRNIVHIILQLGIQSVSSFSDIKKVG